jgi:hypothetical protein
MLLFNPKVRAVKVIQTDYSEINPRQRSLSPLRGRLAAKNQ